MYNVWDTSLRQNSDRARSVQNHYNTVYDSGDDEINSSSRLHMHVYAVHRIVVIYHNRLTVPLTPRLLVRTMSFSLNQLNSYNAKCTLINSVQQYDYNAKSPIQLQSNYIINVKAIK